jgi:anti-anti-sigma factor
MANQPSLRCDVTSSGDTATVVCHGRVLVENVGKFKELVRPLISNHRRIVVDLAAVDFIDSAGLGGLVALKSSAIAAGSCILEFANFSPQLKELLQTTLLSQYLGVR